MIVGWALQTIGAMWALFWAVFIYGCHHANILDANVASQAGFCVFGGLYGVWAGREFRLLAD